MHQHALRALRVPLALLVASAALSIALGTGDEESARPGVGAYLIEFTAAEDCSVTLDGKPLATLKQGERRIVDLETAHGQVLVATAAADGKTWERRLEAGSLQRPALNAITIDFQRASAPSKAEGRAGDSNKPRKSETKGVIPPRLIEATKVRPVYPEAARQARVEGTVLLKAVIETDGRVGEVTLDREIPEGYGFADKARAAVVHWRYEPARYKGKAVRVHFTITVTFTLERDAGGPTREAPARST